MRTSRAVLAASVLVGFLVVTMPAHADSQAQLPITTFGDIAVDGVHDRVFISDPWNGKVIATDFSGSVIGEVTGLPSVEGLALSADSSLLYAAAYDAEAIVSIATDTITEVTRYPVGDGVSPELVTPVDGKLWFGFMSGDDGGFGSLDPADSTVHLNATKFSASPYLYASTAAPGKLVVAGNESTTTEGLAVYDISSGTEIEVLRDDTPVGPLEESAFTPDGSLLVRVGNGIGRQTRIADLTTALTYPALSRANGVDVAADGRVAISVGNKATGDDLYVFDAGQTVASQTIRLDEAATPPDGSGEPIHDGIQDRSVAWEPGGPRLFAVARYEKAYRLQVFNEPESTPTSEPTPTPTVTSEPTSAPTPTPTVTSTLTPVLALNRNNEIFAYGSTTTVTARLGTTATNRVVEIWADPTGTDLPNRLVKRGTVDSSGLLTASVKLTRNTKLTAVFAGDSQYVPRSVSSAVWTKAAVSTAVSKYYKTGKIGSTKYYYFHQKTTPQFTTTMNAYPGRKQKLTVQYYSKGAWRTWSSAYVAVGTNGKSYAKMSGSHPLNGKFRVQGAYLKGSSGDSANYTAYSTWQYFTFKK